MRVVPFPVLGSASSGTVFFRVPYWNWTLCMLKICYPLHKVDVNHLRSNDVWWPRNDHGTVSIDINSIRLIPLTFHDRMLTEIVTSTSANLLRSKQGHDIWCTRSMHAGNILETDMMLNWTL